MPNRPVCNRDMMIKPSRDNIVGKDFALKPYLAKRRQIIDQALQRFFEGRRFQQTRLVAAMQYSINAGGKRLRPILCLASSFAVGGQDESEDASHAFEGMDANIFHIQALFLIKTIAVFDASA